MPLHELERTYLGLHPDGAIAAMPGGAGFWRTIDTNPNLGGYLVTASVGEGDWNTWEMHPEGDEVLIAVEGEGRIVMDHPDGRLTTHDMRTGSMVVVPRGAWHRAVGQTALKLIFITWGAGTAHRPVTDADHQRLEAPHG